MGDKGRILQIMDNLMSNAAKFSPAGEKVELAILAGEGKVRVEVNDKGRGIPKEFCDMVFEKFTQVDSTDTREKGGTGLGLSIAKAIIDLHGGKIVCEAEVGVGSTFYFVLPVANLRGDAAAA